MSHRYDQLAFCVDELERREMLAGEVFVDVTPEGDISIVGDSADNQILLGELGGGLIIQGTDGTLVSFDGDSSPTQTISLGPAGVLSGDLSINLKTGDDAVVLGSLDIDGNLDVQMGAGTDSLRLDMVQVAESVSIHGGSGRYQDHLTLTKLFVDGDLNMDIGASARQGTELLHLIGCRVSGETRILGRSGDQEILFQKGTGIITAWSGPIQISTGGGDDRLLSINHHFPSSVNVQMGGGDDQCLVIANEVGSSFDDLSWNGGGGSDIFAVAALSPIGGNVNGGGGFDELIVTYVANAEPHFLDAKSMEKFTWTG